MTSMILSTQDVCRRLGISEPVLRYRLRQLGAPRPARHPTLNAFLWTEQDVEQFEQFLRLTDRRRGEPGSEAAS